MKQTNKRVVVLVTFFFFYCVCVLSEVGWVCSFLSFFSASLSLSFSLSLSLSRIRFVCPESKYKHIYNVIMTYTAPSGGLLKKKGGGV
ncbi:hypothetical protein QBC42DRAFT_276920 [Cladorrhinum samala]|uniref:Secreted protein n=1 Tax=Cladorrhinum samala TaxID=585594 RepID=A0AAV9HC73_9PEZI|nr:hypothetical protein QBC42DRAFT_276920 [Cladorrhinum samala]